MRQESIDYLASREQAERDAVANAGCAAARRVHEQMADAYATLVELEELRASGALPSGKVITIAEVLRMRGDERHSVRKTPGVRAAVQIL